MARAEAKGIRWGPHWILLENAPVVTAVGVSDPPTVSLSKAGGADFPVNVQHVTGWPPVKCRGVVAVSRPKPALFEYR